MSEFANWPRRARTATLLGISVKRLSALETLGELKARTDFNGRARFDPIEIERLRKRLQDPGDKTPRRRAPTGAQCARIFRMFEEGKELRAVVIESEQPPDVIERLRRQWAEMGHDLVLRTREVANLRELLDWHGLTPQSLCAAVSDRLRYQFERGQRGAAEKTGRKPNAKGMSSGTISGGSEKG